MSELLWVSFDLDDVGLEQHVCWLQDGRHSHSMKQFKNTASKHFLMSHILLIQQ